MYGRPPLHPGITPSHLLPEYFSYPLLSFILSQLWRHQEALLPNPLRSHISLPLTPSDWVYFSPPSADSIPLTPKWKGPLKIILCTPTAAQLEEFPGKLTSWIHISRLKPARPPGDSSGEKASNLTPPCFTCTPCTTDPLKLCLFCLKFPPTIPRMDLSIPTLFTLTLCFLTPFANTSYVWRFKVKETYTQKTPQKTLPWQPQLLPHNRLCFRHYNFPTQL